MTLRISKIFISHHNNDNVPLSVTEPFHEIYVGATVAIAVGVGVVLTVATIFIIVKTQRHKKKIVKGSACIEMACQRNDIHVY